MGQVPRLAATNRRLARVRPARSRAPRDASTLAPVPLDPLPERPLVSILMANYNYGAYIGEAIESVLAQTYDHFELIVVDDASTDDSCAVVERYAQHDPRIILLRSPVNQGQVAAFNRAFAVSRGEIICFLDSDDLLVPTKLEQVVACFRAHPRAGVLNHKMLMVDMRTGATQEMPYVSRFETGWIADRVVRRGGRWLVIAGAALSFRRAVAQCIFPIPDDDRFWGADNFLMPIAPLLAEVAAIEEPLYLYRVHGKNDSAGRESDVPRLQRHCRMLIASTTAVNQRLTELGMTDRLLDYRRNAEYWKTVLLIDLIAHAWSWKAVQSFAHVARLLAWNEMYRPAVRAVRMAIYGVAVILPRPLRSTWMAIGLGYHPFKGRIQSVLSRIRSLVAYAGRRPVTEPLAASSDP